jgi:hypothetical protein
MSRCPNAYHQVRHIEEGILKMSNRFAKLLLAVGVSGAAAGVGFGLSSAIASAASTPTTTTPSSSTPSTTTPSTNNPCPHMGNGTTASFSS